MAVRRIEHNFGGDSLTFCRSGSAPFTSFQGSALLTAGGATFLTFGLPARATCIPLVSTEPAPPVATGMLQGLCLGRPLFRSLSGGVPGTADAAGQLTFSIDPGAVPIAGGTATLSPGDALYVQLWYRDPTAPGGGRFGDAMGIEFR